MLEYSSVQRARWTRRRFLTLTSATLFAASTAAISAPTPPPDRRLSFVHTHTAETLSSIVYFQDGDYVPGALTTLNHFLRDFRNDTTHSIDPQLFDLLYDLQALADRDATYEILSGYRSPETNRMLHERSSGVATHSLHMQGKAIDVRIAGFSCKKLRRFAMEMQRGGVGYYSASNFVHLDTGPVRYWS